LLLLLLLLLLRLVFPAHFPRTFYSNTLSFCPVLRLRLAAVTLRQKQVTAIIIVATIIIVYKINNNLANLASLHKIRHDFR
jgi:hypothetical protein